MNRNIFKSGVKITKSNISKRTTCRCEFMIFKPKQESYITEVGDYYLSAHNGNYLIVFDLDFVHKLTRNENN